MEALKCLGELGPSDLMTLIVKPDKLLTLENSTPEEFFTGLVISLLNTYLIDDNIQLMCPSVAILFDTINTLEGRKVLGKLNSFIRLKIKITLFYHKQERIMDMDLYQISISFHSSLTKGPNPSL